MFSLSGRTAHRVSHFTLLDGIAKFPILLRNTQSHKLSMFTSNLFPLIGASLLVDSLSTFAQVKVHVYLDVMGITYCSIIQLEYR